MHCSIGGLSFLQKAAGSGLLKHSSESFGRESTNEKLKDSSQWMIGSPVQGRMKDEANGQNHLGNGDVQEDIVYSNANGKVGSVSMATSISKQNNGNYDNASSIYVVGEPEGPHHARNPSFCSALKQQDVEADEKKVGRKTCRYGCLFWCRKYFWEGQHLEGSHQQKLANIHPDTPWYRRFLLHHRRVVAFMIPALIFHICWWAVMITRNLWPLFEESYFISITMVFGSIIAGMTSVGGGAVAFPVLTLAFAVKPSVARDFSLMIQSCGMSAAAFTLFFMKVRLEKLSLVVCTLGGAVGCVFGLHLVSPHITPPQKKMAFASIFFAFAVVLAIINRAHKRITFDEIPIVTPFRIGILFLTGIAGGIFTSFSGSGLDICCFSILTLLFRISEKVATPTSVVLMAGNSLVGFFWRGVILQDISQDAWDYLTVCIPIVVLGAPIGSVLGSHFHRLVLAGLVLVLDTAAIIGAYAIIRPLTTSLIVMSVIIIVIACGFFGITYLAGNKLLQYDLRHDLGEENEGKGHDEKSSEDNTKDDISDNQNNVGSL